MSRDIFKRESQADFRVVQELSYRNKVMLFKDRFHAGELLGRKLLEQCIHDDITLLALPAGGVPVGYTVSQVLGKPLDIAVVRKISLPWDSEAGFGAVSWTGKIILNQSIVQQLSLGQEVVSAGIKRTEQNVAERLRKFRGNGSLPELDGKSVIMIDDGLASGFTMLTAVESARDEGAKKVVVAVPTGSATAVELVSHKADVVFCLNVREGLVFAVADAYKHWYDVSDEEVTKLLKKKGNLVGD